MLHGRAWESSRPRPATRAQMQPASRLCATAGGPASVATCVCICLSLSPRLRTALLSLPCSGPEHTMHYLFSCRFAGNCLLTADKQETDSMNKSSLSHLPESGSLGVALSQPACL